MEKIVRRKNAGNKRLNTLVILALAAFAAAAILLFVSGFAVIDVLRGPKSVSAVGEGDEGSYVSVELSSIFGYYAEEVAVDGEAVKGRYAVSFLGGVFVPVRLTERLLDTAEQVRAATLAELDKGGDFTGTEHSFVVTGTVRRLDDDNLAMYYDWYGKNGGREADFSTVLSSYAVEADRIGGMNHVPVKVMSAVAAVCLIFTAAILILASAGVFDLKPEPVPGEGGEDAPLDRDAPDAEAEACINAEAAADEAPAAPQDEEAGQDGGDENSADNGL